MSFSKLDADELIDRIDKGHLPDGLMSMVSRNGTVNQEGGRVLCRYLVKLADASDYKTFHKELRSFHDVYNNIEWNHDKYSIEEEFVAWALKGFSQYSEGYSLQNNPTEFFAFAVTYPFAFFILGVFLSEHFNRGDDSYEDVSELDELVHSEGGQALWALMYMNDPDYWRYCDHVQECIDYVVKTNPYNSYLDLEFAMRIAGYLATHKLAKPRKDIPLLDLNEAKKLLGDRHANFSALYYVSEPNLSNIRARPTLSWRNDKYRDANIVIRNVDVVVSRRKRRRRLHKSEE